jgi:proteasome lid subunit RPN8/RPN11
MIEPSSIKEIRNILGECSASLDVSIDSVFTKLKEATMKEDGQAAEYLLNHVLEIVRINNLYKQSSKLMPESDNTPNYMMNTLFLKNCYKQLNTSEDEDVFYVTGFNQGSTLSLDEIVRFDLERKSPTGAAGDHDSSHKALLELAEYGLCLNSWFHIHPGNGPAAIHPSGIDINYQTGLESGKYPAIGAIFSRDGYIRFFSVEKAYTITIFGKGVETIEENKLYRITQIEEVLHQRRSGIRRIFGHR